MKISLKEIIIRNIFLLILLLGVGIYVGVTKGWLYVGQIIAYLIALFAPLLLVSEMVLLLSNKEKFEPSIILKGLIYCLSIALVYLLVLNDKQAIFFASLSGIFSLMLVAFIIIRKKFARSK